MSADELDALLAEQAAYYGARAAEYDATSPISADDASRATLVDAVEVFAPRGRVLEFACGTGQAALRPGVLQRVALACPASTVR